MEYYQWSDYSLTDEQRAQVFSGAGLSPYNMHKYFSESTKQIPLQEQVKGLNNTDTKNNLDENKEQAGVL